MYTFMYIVSCHDVKMAGGIERRGGHPNHKKVVIRGTRKGESLYPKRHFPDI